MAAGYNYEMVHRKPQQHHERKIYQFRNLVPMPEAKLLINDNLSFAQKNSELNRSENWRKAISIVKAEVQTDTGGIVGPDKKLSARYKYIMEVGERKPTKKCRAALKIKEYTIAELNAKM